MTKPGKRGQIGFRIWAAVCIGFTTAIAIAAISDVPMKLTLSRDGILFLEVNPENTCEITPITPGRENVLIASNVKI